MDVAARHHEGHLADNVFPDAEVTRGELATFFYRYQGTPPVDLDPDSQGCETYTSLAGFHTVGDIGRLGGAARSAWASAVPGIQDVRLQSTLDGEQQPAYWLPPSGEGEQPLLVVLHSWSDDYTQRAGIPYAMWAQENGWAVIAPNFRGPNDNPMAAGSEFAVQDAADAIDFAVAHAGVDADRVYVVGYSGGGMMGLLLAGRHSDRVSAVAAWGPPTTLSTLCLCPCPSAVLRQPDRRSVWRRPASLARPRGVRSPQSAYLPRGGAGEPCPDPDCPGDRRSVRPSERRR